MSESHRRITGLIHELWNHPWGRTLMIAVTVGAVSLALRETSGIWLPVVNSLVGIIIPLSIGFTIAYIVSPLVDRIAKRMNRLLATSVVYCSFIVIVGVLGFYLVPTLVKQGSDLVSRVVEDQVYLDINTNKKRDPEEPFLRPMIDQRGFILTDRYYIDTNRNGLFDAATEQVISRSSKNDFGVDKSLSHNLKLWMESLQDKVRSISAGPSEVHSERLMLYWQAVREPLSLLDQGVKAAKENKVESWLANLPKDSAEICGEDASEVLELDATALMTLVQTQPEPLRRPYETAMQCLMNDYQERHQAILKAMDDQNQGSESSYAKSLSASLARLGRIKDSKNELYVFWERLMQARDLKRQTALAVINHIATPSNSAAVDTVEAIITGVKRTFEEGKKNLPDLAASWSKSVLQDLPSFGRLLLDILLIPIYAFFLTLGMPQVRKSIHAMIPKYGKDHTVRILHAIEKVVAAFFRGRLTVCVVCSIITYLFFAPISVPYAVVFSLLIGFATAIPLMGLIFLVPALALTAMSGGDHVGLRLILVVVAYGLVQILESTILTPTIMGREVELHPVMLIISLMFFGSLLGVLGLILAVPIAATLRILLREFVYPKLGIE